MIELSERVEIPAENEEFISSLPRIENMLGDLYQYKGFWFFREWLSGILTCQKNYKPLDSDIFLATHPKSGTTWLKAIMFALTKRADFPDMKSHPLTSTNPHRLVLNLEIECDNNGRLHSDSRVVSTHMPFVALPDSVVNSRCKIVYLYRNPKDTMVSMYHFIDRIAAAKGRSGVALETVFEAFCNGETTFGPYWDHVASYCKKAEEVPEKVLAIKFEDMVMNPGVMMRTIAEFIGCPFSDMEEAAGLPDQILELCRFANLSEANKTGLHKDGLPNSAFFRRGEVGDWVNFLTNGMVKKINEITADKISGISLNFD